MRFSNRAVIVVVLSGAFLVAGCADSTNSPPANVADAGNSGSATATDSTLPHGQVVDTIDSSANDAAASSDASAAGNSTVADIGVGKSRFETELENGPGAAADEVAGGVGADGGFLLQPAAEELTPEQRHQNFEDALLKGDHEGAISALFPDRTELQNPESAFKMTEHARTVFEKHNRPEKLNEVMASFLFSESAAHAMQKDLDKSMAALEEAVGLGFDGFDYVYMIPFFEPLTSDPKYASKFQEWFMEGAAREVAAFESFPFDFELDTPEGETVKLADFQGKTLIVDVWGTWCPPCQKEIPHFIDLKTKYADKLAIVGINYERTENDEQAKEQISRFLAANQVNYPCVLGDDATMEKIPQFEGFPTTLFIDASGRVRLKVVGYHPMQKLEAIVQAIMGEG